MRIIGGARRGLNLAEVGKGDPSAHLRPTSDRVREAIFNLLINGGYGNAVTGSRVLDLFAGTGALGLEALSRGASSVVFVDNGKAAHELLRANIERMQAESATAVIRRDAAAMGINPAEPYSLVFLDPPYRRKMGHPALESCRAGRWIAPQAMIVWEENEIVAAAPGFDVLDRRRYGDTFVTLLTSVG